jgi:hypothetical protein
MTNEHGKGGGAPADDRTILDPLNADELKALREARERFQKNAQRGGAVVGPDTGEDIGDAPTRAMSALPSFDNAGASLDKLGPPAAGSPKIIADPKPMAPGSARISAPMAAAPPPAQHPPAAAQGAPAQQPGVGQPGFGENTLMWMAPVKVEEPQIIPERGQAAAAGMIPTAVPQETKGRRAMLIGVGAAGAVVVVGMLIFAFAGGSKPGVIELVTNPPKAAVKIDGKSIDVATPMKATLQPGAHTIEITLDGYKPEVFSVDVKDGQKPSRRTIDLFPISKPGLLTVSIEVQPVSANISFDGTIHSSKKTVRVANIDPKAPHKLLIEAGGYSKIELDIAASQLKESYNFVLQPEKNEETN